MTGGNASRVDIDILNVDIGTANDGYRFDVL
jgi:hypothetical protein